MRPMLTMLTGLFRPARALDAVGAAAKWVWIPAAVLLVVSTLIKTGVAAPLQTGAIQEQADAVMAKQIETMPEEDRRAYEESMAEMEASGDVMVDTGDGGAMAIVSTASMVFGAVGALMALIYIAGFFFITAKTQANPVGFPALLTAASLSLLPHAIRNIVQAAYMAGSGSWIQHNGLGALVAPADYTQAPGVAYAILSQIDIWTVWGLALLFGALLSKAVGFDKKRATSAMLLFVAVTGVAQALPTLVQGALMGAM